MSARKTLAAKKYEVEAVVGKRINNGIVEYRLKWKGYNSRSWRPVTECHLCKMLVDQFEMSESSALVSSNPAPPTEISAQSASTTSLTTTMTQTIEHDHDYGKKQAEAEVLSGTHDCDSTPANEQFSDPRSLNENLASALGDSSHSSDVGPTPSKRAKQPRSEFSPEVPTRKSPCQKTVLNSSIDESVEDKAGNSIGHKRSSVPTRMHSVVQKPIKPTTKRTRSLNSKMSNGSDSYDESKLPQIKSTIKRRSSGESASTNDDPARALEAVLMKAIATDPYLHEITQPGSKVPAKANDVIVPVNIFYPEDLPGINVWTEKSYEEFGYKIADSHEEVKMFGDREVVKIVGYVLHWWKPFVLVQLAPKKNEKTVRVKDVVQAVQCKLASRLFNKAVTDYTNRVADELLSSVDVSPNGKAPSPTAAPIGRVSRRRIY